MKNKAEQRPEELQENAQHQNVIKEIREQDSTGQDTSTAPELPDLSDFDEKDQKENFGQISDTFPPDDTRPGAEDDSGLEEIKKDAGRQSGDLNQEDEDPEIDPGRQDLPLK